MAQAQAILSPISVDIDIQRNGVAPNQADRRAMLRDSIRLIPASKGISELRDRFSKPLHVIFGMLGIGLLLACINVVSLQLARSDQSRKEFSIRLAIGAGRLRVARQCLVEMLMVAAAGACLGLLLFKPVTNAVVSLMTVWGDMPARLELRLDGNVLSFVLMAGIGVTLLCGLLPAIYATRQELHAGLQSGASTIAGRQSRKLLVRSVGIVQIAVSLVTITATCLFAFNLRQLHRFDGGIRRHGLLQIEIDSGAAGYNDKRAILLDGTLRGLLRSISGVERVTYSQDGIYSGRNFSTSFSVDGNGASSSSGYGIYDYVGPNFFTTLGTTVLAGRDFSDRDNAAAPPVVVVNQTLANRFFANQNPVGQKLYISDQNAKKAYQIIGVVRDVRSNLRSADLMWYFAEQQDQIHPFSTCFLIRGATENPALLPRIRAVVHKEDPILQIGSVRSANELFDGTLETDRLLARLGWAFGILAILLASVGIYGLLSYDVTRRTGEMGIRTALGASRSGIAKLILSQTVLILACGLVLGGLTANLMTRLIRSLVFGMNAADPRIELTAAVLLAAVALAAAWFPIRRAVRLEPMQALRTE